MTLKMENTNFTNIKPLFRWIIWILVKSYYLIRFSLGRKDFKYYIGYKDAKKITPLCIFLPQMGAYRRDFDETKSISLNYLTILIKDNELLGKYNKIGKKFSNIFKKEFDSKFVYNEKYLKTKIKSCNGKINTKFHNNKMPKEDCQCICLSVTLIDSVHIKDKNYLVKAT